MATAGKEVSRLFLTLGLDMSQLEAGLTAANAEINRAMGNWNRQKNIIRLKMEADVAGLDPVKDKTKILAIQEKALNELLDIQNKRLSAVSARYKDVAAAQGTSSAASQKLQIQYERERLAVARLKQEINSLASQKPQQTNTNSLLTGYQNLKGGISGVIGKYNELSAAMGSADSIMTKGLTAIQALPHPYAKAAAAIALIPVALLKAEEEFARFTRPAAQAGAALYDLAKSMNTSYANAGKMKSVANFAGADLGTLISSVKRLESNYLKAGESGNELTRTLSKWNVTITDAHGRLLPFEQLMGALSEGFERAERAGMGEEYALTTLGVRGQEAAKVLRDFKKYWQEASEVQKNGLINPELSKKTEMEFRKLDEQMAQAKVNFQAALLPIAAEILPDVIEKFRLLAAAIAENKDEIKAFAEATGTALKNSPLAVMVRENLALLGGAVDLAKAAKKEMRGDVQNAIADKDVKSLDDYVKKYKELDSLSKLQYDTNPEAKKRIEAKWQEEYNQVAAAKAAEAEEKAVDRRREAQKTAGQQINALDAPATEEELARIAKLNEDTQKLITEATKKETEARLAALKRERVEKIRLAESDEERESVAREIEEEITAIEQTQIDERIAKITEEAEKKKAAVRTDEERAAIVANAEAKITQITQEEAARREEITRASLDRAEELNRDAENRIFNLTHDSFEKQLREIDRWKAAQYEKADTAEEVAAIIKDAAAKEAEAFEAEVDRMKGKIESAQDRLARLTMSQKDYDTYKAEKQYREDIASGIPQNLAKQIYDATLGEIRRKSKEDTTGSYGKGESGTSWGVIDFDNLSSSMDAQAMAVDAVNGKYGTEYESIVRNIDARNRETAAISDGIDIIGWGAGSLTEAMNDAATSFGTEEYQPPSSMEILDRLLPQDLSKVFEGMTRGGVYEDSYGNWHGKTGYLDSLGNLFTNGQSIGIDTAELFGLLKQMNKEAERYKNPQGQQGYNFYASVSVNVDNVNADRTEEVNRAAEQVAKAVTEQIQSMKNGINKSYGEG